MKRILSAVLMLSAILCSALSIWLAWPMLNFSTYPHVPDRAYAGMLAMIVASALVPKRSAMNRAPADMIIGIIIVVVAAVMIVCGLNQCGRHDYGNLEHVLAEAPK